MRRAGLVLLCCAGLLASGARAADLGPVWPPPGVPVETWSPPETVYARPLPGRPPRRVTGGPDDRGSAYGLGKPAYSGIGPRPDWGRSTVD